MDLISPIHEKAAYLVGNKWECNKCLHVNIGDAHINCIGCGDPKAQTKSNEPSTADSLNNISIGIQSVQDKMRTLAATLKSNTQQTAEALGIAKKLSTAADIGDVRRSIQCRDILGVPLGLQRLERLLDNFKTNEVDYTVTCRTDAQLKLTYFEDEDELNEASCSELLQWAQVAAQCEAEDLEHLDLDDDDHESLEQVVRHFIGLPEADEDDDDEDDEHNDSEDDNDDNSEEQNE